MTSVCDSGGAGRVLTGVLVPLVCVALLVVLKSGTGIHGSGDFLWAEDGNLFLRQAFDMGPRSILEPYAGYLHTYARIWSALAVNFPVEWWPSILFTGWLASVYLLASACLALYPADLPGRLMGVASFAAIALQPSNGEVFFSITNSQWMTGLALALYCFGVPRAFSSWQPVQLALFLLLSLSGPFSLFLSPLVICAALASRGLSLRQRWHIQVPILVGALLQFLNVARSERVDAAGGLAPLSDWLMTLFNWTAFGSTSYLSICAAAVFWLALLTALVRSKKSEEKFNAIMLLCAGLLIAAAALYSHAERPLALASTVGGTRYAWMPTSLAFVGALLLTRHRPTLLVTLLSAICLLNLINFSVVDRQRTNFISYARFARVVPQHIPINPFWERYPGWVLPARTVSGGAGIAQDKFRSLSLAGTTESGLEVSRTARTLHYRSNTDTPNIVLRDKLHCEGGGHVGIVVSLNRSEGGWVRLFWSETEPFTDSRSLRRWYPEGPVKARFAFPIQGSVARVRLDPTGQPGNGRITDIRYICLGP